MLLDGALRRTDTDTLCAPAWHPMDGEHSAPASLCPHSVLRPSDMGSLCGGEGTADTQGTARDATSSKSTGGINKAMWMVERKIESVSQTDNYFCHALNQLVLKDDTGIAGEETH